MESTSVWTLKKRPLPEVAAFIMDNGSEKLQAEMARLPMSDYRSLNAAAAADRIMTSISKMDDETYTGYLLDIIDE
ncbi:hypothetical protein [Gorillibacterium sp. sgz5001074]|uniref:hypothetical protein n=1 Tax=Gorillibacterium sp. sgz5001074 TaxID=3446695 RepID=UPI003F66C8F6